MALDSDVNGADSQLHVDFYEHPGPDPNADLKYKGKTFIRIIVPGDPRSIIDTIAQEHHKKRFAHHWLRFQMKQEGTTIAGISLDTWLADRPMEVNADQIAELRIFKFQVVEQVARMPDGIAQKIGMGGIGLREKAIAYLRDKNKSEIDSELATTRNELAELKAQMQAFMSAQKTVEIAVPEADKPEVAAAQKRRGPKPGWKNKVNVQHSASTGTAGNP